MNLINQLRTLMDNLLISQIPIAIKIPSLFLLPIYQFCDLNVRINQM